MSRLDGAVVLDKPSGPTSFAAMRTAQRALGQRTAGHGGTLDPLASGVLVVLLGEGRKLSALVMDHTKTYEAEVRLGVGTDTLDAAGAVTAEAPIPPDALDRARIEALLPTFVGEVMQVPPRYSALKVEGRSHMSRARAGEDFEVAARPALCLGLELLAVLPDGLRLRIDCGKGYYVRSLARDLGAALGVPSHLATLRRTRVGAFTLAQAVAPAAATPADVIPIAAMLPDLPLIVVAGRDLADLRAGRTIPVPSSLTASPHPGSDPPTFHFRTASQAAPPEKWGGLAPSRWPALALTSEGEPIALVEPAADDPTRLKVRRGFQPTPND